MTRTLFSWSAHSLRPTSSNGAVFGEGSQNDAYVSFDASTDQSADTPYEIFPEGLTTPLTLILRCRMATATSGDVIFQAAVEAVTPGDSFDTDAGTSFDTANSSGAVTVPGTAGYVFEVSLTLTNNDSMASGDSFRIRINRDADAGGDTASGLCHVLAVALRDAA